MDKFVLCEIAWKIFVFVKNFSTGREKEGKSFSQRTTAGPKNTRCCKYIFVPVVVVFPDVVVVVVVDDVVSFSAVAVRALSNKT